MKVLVALPSFNEAQNIVPLVTKILELSEQNYVVVVDDNSPDNTLQILEDAISRMPPKDHQRIHAIKRMKKNGRGGAVWEGINWGLSSGIDFTYFIEMDCDFSHSPDAINEGILKLSTGHDLVLGSRYPDGKIINWPLRRRLFSYIANVLCRFLIDRKIHDYTNGFRFYNQKSARYLADYDMSFSGYINLSETLCKLLKNNFSIASFPIIFINRELGASNTNFTEMFHSFLAIFRIAYRYRFDKKF